jgi:hypothetical protein
VTTAAKLTALMRKTGPVPNQWMSRPAMPGPMSRPAWNEALLRPTAFGRSSVDTSSETNACRAGASTALTVPSSSASR